MIRDDLVEQLRAALAAAGVEPPEDIGIERPTRREHGDWSSNVALASAKRAGTNPRQLAQQVADALNAAPPAHVDRVELAGPGFINFHLRPSWLHDVLVEVVTAGRERYAAPDLGAGQSVIVEFVSANPTGPVHAGHARGAAYGESLRARKKGTDVPDDGYHGQYIAEWAVDLPAGVDPAVWGEERALTDQREVLGSFNVRFDVWFSERSMVDAGAIDATLADLREHGVVYEADGATWLRSTDDGDDKDRVLIKSDGEFTYLLPDIAYHRDKFSRAQRLINVWGADHHGYVPRMRAAMQALGHDPSDLDVQITQMVDLLEGGEPLKLSKRAGTVIELRDIVDIAGTDAARLTYLLQSIDSRQTVDMALVVSQGMDNPVYYVQMAHARIHGIARRAAESGVVRAPLADVDLSVLVHERELDVLRSLSELPEVIEVACNDRAPHRVTTWVRELAGAFHGFYHDCYVVGDDVQPALTQARLWLVEAARIGFAIGLDLLGVSAPESM